MLRCWVGNGGTGRAEELYLCVPRGSTCAGPRGVIRVSRKNVPRINVVCVGGGGGGYESLGISMDVTPKVESELLWNAVVMFCPAIPSCVSTI